jgi:hypothetical protein
MKPAPSVGIRERRASHRVSRVSRVCVERIPHDCLEGKRWRKGMPHRHHYLSFRGPATLNRPPLHRLQGRGIYRRPARGRTRQPAPPPRLHHSRTVPVRGDVADHQEPESRFLSRRQSTRYSPVPRGASFGMTDRCDETVLRNHHPYSAATLSFRGPATLNLSPAPLVAGPRNLPSATRGPTRQPAPSLRLHHSRPRPVLAVEAGHEEAESRFLGWRQSTR